MTINNKIVHILIMFCAIFFAVILYLSWFELYYKGKISEEYSSIDPRTIKEEVNILRGEILDRNKTVLAKSEMIDEDKQVREYPFGKLYSHVIGYSSVKYGKNGLEKTENLSLLDLKTSDLERILSSIRPNDNKKGNHIQLTIDHKLQKVAYDSFGNEHNGAVIAIEPSTGKVLALVSKPDFNPNEEALDENWQNMQENEERLFFPRATSGTYAPGSTFKTITSIAAFENGLENYVTDDKGFTTIDGKKFPNAGGAVHGNNLDIRNALKVSSNVYFTELGVKIGAIKLMDVCDKAMINKKIDFDLPLAKSTVKLEKNNKVDIASVSMGQGRLKITPFQLAMISAAIANGGIMMEPYLVDKVIKEDKETGERTVIDEIRPKELSRLTTKTIADELTTLMVNVVNNGTGSRAKINNISIAGKTGTAENELKGKEHVWFMAFAPAENPKIAVVVMKEYTGGYSGPLTSPAIKAVIQEYLN